MIKKGLFLFCILSFFSMSAQTYIKSVGVEDANDGPTTFLATQEYLYIAGYIDEVAYIKALNLKGEDLWNTTFDFSEDMEYVSDLAIDGNYLIGCGYGHASGTDKFHEFFFKMDLATQKMEWVKRNSLKLKPNNIHVLASGEYLITGDEFANNKFGVFLLKINAADGVTNNFTTWYYSGRESASVSFVKDGTIYVGGRYGLKAKTDKYRGAISVFDVATFDQEWSRYYLNTRQKYVRNYLSGLATDEENILAAFSTNNMGVTSHYTPTLAKISNEGSLQWAYEYLLDGYTDVKVRDMKVVSDGYLIYGFTKSPSTNLFLIKTDREGVVSWAKEYGSENKENILADQGSFVAEVDDYIYFVGQSNDETTLGDFNTLLLKVYTDGTSDSTHCWGTDISISRKKYAEKVDEEMALTQYDTIYKSLNVKYENVVLDNHISSFVCSPIDFKEGLFENVAINNVTFLLDLSQSMNNSNRLPVLKTALSNTLGKMRSIDKISAISYSNDAQFIFEVESANDKSAILSKIDSLEASGQSAIEKGLKLGIENVEKHFKDGGNNRVILTTDGTISNDRREELKSILQKQFPEEAFFSIFLFSDSQDYLNQMQELAATVDGQVFVMTAENAEAILLQEFQAIKK